MSQKHLQVISLILKFEKCGWLDLNIFSMASLPVVKRQRNVLNIEDKVKIINEHSKNNVSVKMIAQKYEVGIQTVYDIIKTKKSF